MEHGDYIRPRSAAPVAAALLAVAVAAGVSTANAQESSDSASGASPSDTATTASAEESDAPVLTPADALEAALADNHDLAIEATELEIAARNASLGNAEFLPTVRAVASQNHLFGGSGIFGQGRVFTRTTLGVEANWVLFDGLGRFSTYDRLKALRSAEEIEREARIEETLAEVAIAYYDVVRQRRLLEAFEKTLEVSKQRVDIAEARLEAGAGSEVDANLARVELNRDRSAVAEQRIAVTESKTELNRLMGRKADRSFRVETAIEIRSGLEYDNVRSTALEENPTLETVRRRQHVAAERVREARAERWPEVRLSLGYNYTEFHTGVAPDFDVPAGLEYGIDISIPLFDGFSVTRDIANAASERSIREAELRRERTRIRKQVRDAFSAYRRHLERIEMARKSVGLADENVEVALTELEAGTIIQVELRQVQLNLQDARTRLIDAKFNAKRAELRLLGLMGRLSDRYVE